MKKIEKLTKTQEEQIPKYIEKFFKQASKKTDRKKATAAIGDLYESIKKKRPIVIYAQSPIAAVIMIAMCKILFKEKLIKDGGQLGDQLSDQLRDQLRGQLGDQLSDQLRDQLDDQLRGQLGGQLYDQLHDQLRDQLRDQFCYQLSDQLCYQLSDQLCYQLSDQLRDQLRGQFYDQLDGQLGDQLSDQLRGINNKWWLVIWWLAWAGWYAFGKYIGVKFTTNIFNLFMNFVMNVSFIIPYEGIAFVSETPQKISWEDKKLHSITEAAVKYSDGYSLYALHGVRFDKKLWEKVVNKKITTKELLSITNIEQRMAALKVLGIEVLLEDAVMVDKVSGYELYEIKNVFIKTAYYLKYKCPSTGRIYISGINPIIGAKRDAIEALKWKFELEDVETNDSIFDMES